MDSSGSIGSLSMTAGAWTRTADAASVNLACGGGEDFDLLGLDPTFGILGSVSRVFSAAAALNLSSSDRQVGHFLSFLLRMACKLFWYL